MFLEDFKFIYELTFKTCFSQFRFFHEVVKFDEKWLKR